MTTANQKLERWETIKRFEILPAEFAVEEGEVTANQKIRRRAVEQKYADRLDSMYNPDRLPDRLCKHRVCRCPMH